jgi:large subunit ribosomal protein L25
LEIANLKVSLRDTVGDGPSRTLRRDGKIPAILYGPRIDPLKLTIDRLDLEPVIKTGSVAQKLLRLEIEGLDRTPSVMIKEVQKHPVTHSLLHVDLYEVIMDQKIKVMIPVVTTGNSIGVEMGGMLQTIRREVEVLCLPDQIPDSITVDITHLDVGDSVHVKDLKVPETIEVPADGNFTILTIRSTQEEVAEGEELEAGEADGAKAGDASSEG